MNTPSTQKPLTQLKRDIRAFLKARGDKQSKIVSKAEWQRRGEQYGRGTKFVLIIDGSSLYETLNYGTDKWASTIELTTICRKHGFWYEPLYGWALGFYEG